MKKLGMILIMVMILTITAFADSVTTVQTLGIMNGDEFGNMNLEAPVTRAEFAKMLVAASSEKDNEQPRGSVFKDLKTNHWASGYVKLAVTKGWIAGYTDGTFRPESPIQAVEAYAMGLRLMGYNTSNLAGDFRSAVMNLAEKTNLNDGISNTGTMLRSDCAILFENILCNNTPTGVAYGSTLGYTVIDGGLDLNSITAKDLKGPYVYEGTWTYSTPTTVLLNDKVSSFQSLQTNDVYYYNTVTKVAYVYRQKAYGTITAVAGTTITPTSVTVQGISYTLATNTAKLRISGGSVAEGQAVTLLLDEHNNVVDILDQISGMVNYYGLITNESISELGEKLTVLCTDGVERVFDVKSTSYDLGDTVEVTIGETVTMKRISNSKLSGKITTTKVGSYKIADNMEILDVAHGKAKSIYLSRVVGDTISSGDVLCYKLNEDEEITHLMLDNATGDLSTYGYLSDKTTMNTETSLQGFYDVVIGGKEMTIPTVNILYPVEIGGIFLEYNRENGLETMGRMTTYDLDAVVGLLGKSGTKTISIWESVDVFLKTKDGYLPADLTDAQSGDYEMTGYMDKYNLGKQVRVILLETK